ncbi:cytochrome P450 736A117-like [Cornus florida]|uniref:cytochrome P450 736A117-like n=1 Tax=Cornus florida TaxID=4283 RepID=UPI002897A71C|nr:cytochrome P450 736A117-like [Cornus florida]
MVLLLHLPFYSLPPLLFSIFFLFKWLSTSQPQRNLPPSPPKFPIIGNLHQLGVFPHRSLQSLAQKYGPIMLLHFGSKPVLIVSSADAAREIMKTHDLIFSNRPKLSIASRVFYNKDVAFVPYGEYWRQVKSICVLNLLSNRRVQSYRGVREEETALLIEKIKSASSSSSSPVNLSEMLVSLTNDVVCRVALGGKYSESSKSGRKFKDLLGDTAALLGEFSVGDYIPWLVWLNQINGANGRVEKIAKELDEFLEGVIGKSCISVNELALANLIHKFDFTLPDGTTEEDFDMTEAPGISIHRKYPLRVVATPCSFASHVLAT